MQRIFQELQRIGRWIGGVCPHFCNIANRNCYTKSDVTMNKQSIHSSIPAVEKSKASGNTLVAVLCLTFFPLVFIIGKMAASLLGN
jgi:hypothetical protein